MPTSFHFKLLRQLIGRPPAQPFNTYGLIWNVVAAVGAYER